SGIDVEVRGSDEHVLRVRCLEDRDSSRTEHPQRLVEQLQHEVEGQVLDDVQRSQSAQAAVGHVTKRLERVAQLDLQAAFAALLDGGAIRIDAGRDEALGLKHLDQLAPAAAQIEDRRRVRTGPGGAQLGDIHGDALLDVFAAAAEFVFEVEVDG